MAGHSENISRSELWGGDGSPFRISMVAVDVDVFGFRCPYFLRSSNRYGFEDIKLHLGLLRRNLMLCHS